AEPCGNRVLGNNSSRCDPSDLIITCLSKPEVAIRACSNIPRNTGRCRDWVLNDDSGCCYPPDIVAIPFSKPEVAIRACSNIPKPTGCCGYRVLINSDRVGWCGRNH